MNNNVAKIVFLSLALVLFAAALWVYRPVSNKSTRVAVTGEARAKVSPDTAVVTFSVVTQNAAAFTAQQENARKSEAVKAAVEAIAAGGKIEVKTSEYNLSPEQDYYSGKLPKILGYTVKNTVKVSIGDLTRVGAVIDAATKAGANSIESTEFVVREDSPAQGDALALATKQALAKAESIAKSLNGRVLRVVETNEGGIPVQASPSDYRERMQAMSNAASMSEAKRTYTTPVEAGSLNIQSHVVLVVEIGI